MTDLTFPKNNRLLVIDDNQAIHDDFRKILQPADESLLGLKAAGVKLFADAPQPSDATGFELDSAHSGEEGLSLVQKALAEGRPYAVAFVDVRMGAGWNGIETTAYLCQHDPDIQIVICTAYSDYSWEEMIKKLGQSDRLLILKKPFDNIEVLQMAHALTEKWILGQKARVRMDQLQKMVIARTYDLQAANEQLRIEMAERAQTEEILRQAQKMEAVGKLAGGIAHDFNNLLTIIRGHVGCLLMEMPPGGQEAVALQEIDAAAERAAKLTAQILLFSRKKQMQPQVLNLNELITRLGTLLRRLLGENITMEIVENDEPLTIHADPVMIEMVILNLAVNARDAMPQGGKLSIKADEIEIKSEPGFLHSQARPGRFACLRVEDTGCGMSQEVLTHLFEPFFTTKEVGQGTGLGLASIYGIVNQHSGWVDVESEPDHGTKFKIFLPIWDQSAGLDISPELKTPAEGGNETILLVEDEKALRQVARMILQRSGYHVCEAGTGAEALSVWEEHASKINLLLTDIVMPGGLSGLELAVKLREKKADLKIIYTSGYIQDAINHKHMLKEGRNFLIKPYHPDELATIVRHCLDGSDQD